MTSIDKHRPTLIKLTFFLMLLLCFKSNAQQLPQFTHYMFNRLVINPAYAGADGPLSLTLANRSQWLGVDGAPTTQTFTAHSMFKNKKNGLGLSLINDKIGVHKNLTALGHYAYHIEVRKDWHLSTGLTAGINHKQSDYLSLPVANDPNRFEDISTSFLVLGAGLYFKSPRLEIGISAPEIFSSGLSTSNGSNLNKTHYFFFSQYSHRISSSLSLVPSILVKYLHNLPLSYDLNLNTTIKNVLTIGLSYRKSESIDFLFKLQLLPQLAIAYTYDYPIGNTPTNSGSHEVMVNYVFKFRQNTDSPR